MVCLAPRHHRQCHCVVRSRRKTAISWYFWLGVQLSNNRSESSQTTSSRLAQSAAAKA